MKKWSIICIGWNYLGGLYTIKHLQLRSPISVSHQNFQSPWEILTISPEKDGNYSRKVSNLFVIASGQTRRQQNYYMCHHGYGNKYRIPRWPQQSLLSKSFWNFNEHYCIHHCGAEKNCSSSVKRHFHSSVPTPRAILETNDFFIMVAF